jgi:hypothetical protein
MKNQFTRQQIVIIVLFVVLAMLCAWLFWALKWIRDRKDVIESNHYQGRVQVRLIDPELPPWSVGVLQGPGYKTIMIYTQEPSSPSATEQAAQQELMSLFPEANVVFGNHEEGTP